MATNNEIWQIEKCVCKLRNVYTIVQILAVRLFKVMCQELNMWTCSKINTQTGSGNDYVAAIIAAMYVDSRSIKAEFALYFCFWHMSQAKICFTQLCNGYHSKADVTFAWVKSYTKKSTST